MDFQTFHRYNRLARRGVVETLTCQHCGATLVLGLDTTRDDAPVLRCIPCNVTTIPGLLMFEKLKAQVEEWYV